MKNRIRQIVCMMLMLGLVLGTIRYGGETSVQAADVSSSTTLNGSAVSGNTSSTSSTTTETKYYRWHRAYTVDDLKKYTDSDENTTNTTNYSGKWVPIVIVACYGDQKNPTMYYWNRKTKLDEWTTGRVPYMTAVDKTTSTGLYLSDAITNGKEDSFITEGDMGAMHMYYHGYITDKRQDNGADNYTVKTDAWSLTQDDVDAYSSDAPETVWGSLTYLTLGIDINDVKKWNGTKGLPTTTGQNDDETYRLAWTFYQDEIKGQFLIANLFADSLDEVISSDTYATVFGAATELTWSHFWEAIPTTNTRHVLDSIARPYIFDNFSSNKVLEGEDARSTILSAYNDKYSDSSVRASFRIYIGEEIDTQSNLKTTTVSDGMTMRIGYGDQVGSGSSITVKEGGTLIIPEDGLLYLDGTINIDGGTVIVSKNATITSTKYTPVKDNGKYGSKGFAYDPGRYGRIECFNGGRLLIQGGAKLYLNQGLILDNGTCVNNGMLVLNQLLTMVNSEMQIKSKGYLGVGFSYGTQPKYFYMETKRPSENLYVNANENNYRPSVIALKIDDSSKIVFNATQSANSTSEDRLEISGLALYFSKQSDVNTIGQLTDACVEFYDNFVSPLETTKFEFNSSNYDKIAAKEKNQVVCIKTGYSNDSDKFTYEMVPSDFLNKCSVTATFANQNAGGN